MPWSINFSRSLFKAKFERLKMQRFQKANISDPVVRADTSIAFINLMEGGHVVSLAQAIKALRVANINILSSGRFDTTSAPFFPVNFSPF